MKSRPLRILHIYDGHEHVRPGAGSVPSIVFFLARHVGMLGHHVSVLERHWSIEEPREEIVDGVRFIRVPSPQLCSTPYLEFRRGLPGAARLVADRVLLGLRFRKCLSAEEYDVYHVHTPFAATVLLITNPALGRKLVYTAHIGEERERLRLADKSRIPWLLRIFSPDLYVMKRAALVVLLHERLGDILVSRGIVDHGKVEVIPALVIPHSALSPIQLQEARVRYRRDNRLLVLFGGTITPRKGVQVLVEAASIVFTTCSDTRPFFVLAGDKTLNPEFTSTVLDAISSRGLSADFLLPGLLPHEEYRLLLEASDVFVLPSYEEGDPVALREALIAGKPLIGTNVGGIPVQVRHEWNGFVVPSGDSIALADALARLVRDADLRRKMAHNSRRLAVETFSPESIVEKYVEVYRRVVTRGDAS